MEVSPQKFVFKAVHPNELMAIADDIIASAGESRMFKMVGEMGAGKTTLVKALCAALGVTDHVTSPTFTLVNEYQDGEGSPVYHFDFYRLKNESEALDFGFESYLYSGNYCFMEWPEKVAGLLPGNCASISMEVCDDERLITLSL